MTLERAIDAFIRGRLDFPTFHQLVGEQLAAAPGCEKPALKRLAWLKEAGRVSPALYAVITEEIARSAQGDITAPIDEHDIDADADAQDMDWQQDLDEPQAFDEGDDEPILPPPPATGSTTRPKRPPVLRNTDHADTAVAAPAPAAPRPTRSRWADAPPPKPQPPRSALDRAESAPPAASAYAAPSPSPAPSAPRSPTASAPAPPPPVMGTVLGGRYRLDTVLERGGMNIVYRATDLGRSAQGVDDAQVAIKLVNPEFAGRGARRALEREATLLAELSHPGIVRMLGYYHDGERAFMVMELLGGERLRNRLVRSHPAPLPADEAMQIIRALGEALAYLHGEGVVHRDVKPANIFISHGGEPRLLDFGLAAQSGRPGDLDSAAPQAWTPLYASPEMLSGAPPDPRDDVYSFGCVVYEVLTGRHPWGNLSVEEAARRRIKPTQPRGLSKPRWRILQKALAFKAGNRPANAAVFLAAFFPQAKMQGVLPWAAAALVGGVAVAVALMVYGPYLPLGGPSPALPPATTPTAVDPPVDLPPLEDPPGLPAVDEDAGPAEIPGTEVPVPVAEEGVEAPAQVAEAEGPAAPADPPAAVVPAPEEEPARQQDEVASVPEDPVATPPAAAATPPADPAPADPVPADPAPARPAPAPAGPPALAFGANRYNIMESGTALRLEMPRPAGYAGPLRVQWRTIDQSARHNIDFVGSPNWRIAQAPPEAASLVIFIPIVDDSVPGPDVTFHIELLEMPGGPPVGEPARAAITIIDDD